MGATLADTVCECGHWYEEHVGPIGACVACADSVPCAHSSFRPCEEFQQSAEQTAERRAEQGE